MSRSWSFSALIRFLRNSKEEKKTAFTAQDLPIDTPKPRYICLRKNSTFTGGTLCPREYIRQFR